MCPPPLQPLSALALAPGLPGLPASRRDDGAAVHDLHPVREKAVEMYRPILVQLRYQDIPEPVPPYLVITPDPHSPHDLCEVIAVYLGLVQC